jgi:transposase
MTQYVGLDVSLKETKLHVLDEAGNRVWRGRCATEPAAIAAAVRRYAPTKPPLCS